MSQSFKHLGVRARGAPTMSELLYFDEIVVLDPLHFDRPEDAASHDYLAAEGAVVDARGLLSEHPELSRELEQHLAELQRLMAVAEATWGLFALGPFSLSRTNEAAAYARASRDARSVLEKLPRYRVTSILDPAQLRAGGSGATDPEVSEVMIRSLPTPAPDTPLEALMDFRADEEARGALRRLRRWAGTAVEKGSTPTDLQEELEGLLDDYREVMRLHRMKHENGVLRTLVTVANATGTLPAIAAGLLSLGSNRLALTEAELGAKGREVAYIPMVEERFRTTG